MCHKSKLNQTKINGRHFIQRKRCGLRTVAHYSYAIIYMDKFENTYIDSEIKNDSLFCARYIDDIFIIYIGKEAKLNNFLTNLNMIHDSIKLGHQNSSHSIAFLDTLIYIDKNRQLQTTLLNKHTNTHNDIHYRSSHPKYLKDSFPNWQAIRQRRICALKIQSDELEQQFSASH